MQKKRAAMLADFERQQKEAADKVRLEAEKRQQAFQLMLANMTGIEEDVAEAGNVGGEKKKNMALGRI